MDLGIFNGILGCRWRPWMQKLFQGTTFIGLLHSQNRSCDHVIEFHSLCQLCPLKSMITKSLQTLHAFHYSSHFKPLTEGGLITPGGHNTLPEWWILACCTSSYMSRNQLKLLHTIREMVPWCQLVLNTWNILDFSWFNVHISQVHIYEIPKHD